MVFFLLYDNLSKGNTDRMKLVIFFFCTLFLSVNPSVIIFFFITDGFTDRQKLIDKWFTNEAFSNVIPSVNNSTNTNGKSIGKYKYSGSVLMHVDNYISMKRHVKMICMRVRGASSLFESIQELFSSL